MYALVNFNETTLSELSRSMSPARNKSDSNDMQLVSQLARSDSNRSLEAVRKRLSYSLELQEIRVTETDNSTVHEEYTVSSDTGSVCGEVTTEHIPITTSDKCDRQKRVIITRTARGYKSLKTAYLGMNCGC